MNQDLRILIVEDKKEFRKEVARSMLPFNEVIEADSISSARKLLTSQSFDVVILDKGFPDGEAIQLVPEIVENHPNCGLFILTGDGDRKLIPKYKAAGVHDYIEKSEHAIFDLKLRIPSVLSAIAERRKSKTLQDLIDQSFRYEIIGSSESTRTLRERIFSLKGNQSPILITGPTGTGKELVARMLNKIETPSRLFVTVNCGAIPEGLIESELFGHKRGAFTGANRDQVGKFELAHHGDIFLDEVGDLPLAAQVKLLRVLQEGEFNRVGDAVTRRVSIRVMAATNKDLLQLVREGKFRSDLYYRLNVIPIETKPLNERKEDIPDIAKFILTFERKGKFSFGKGVHELLTDQQWEGNIRELGNVIKRAIHEADRRESCLIEPRDVSFLRQVQSDSYLLPRTTGDLSLEHLEKYMENAERLYFDKALSFFDNNVEALARHINYSRSGLFRKLSSLGLTRRRGGLPVSFDQETDSQNVSVQG